MNLIDLQILAMESHGGNLQTSKGTSMLEKQQEYLGVSVAYGVAEISTRYDTPLLVADLGCYVASVAADLNEMHGVKSFGVDLRPHLPEGRNFPKYRLIVADLNSMPEIADNTFHYVMSFNVLAYTKLEQSLPEIFRILKPGGIADLDIEFWEMHHRNELENTPVHESLRVKGIVPVNSKGNNDWETKDFGTINEHLVRIDSDPEDLTFKIAVARGTMIEMRKPYTLY